MKVVLRIRHVLGQESVIPCPVSAQLMADHSGRVIRCRHFDTRRDAADKVDSIQSALSPADGCLHSDMQAIFDISDTDAADKVDSIQSALSPADG